MLHSSKSPRSRANAVVSRCAVVVALALAGGGLTACQKPSAPAPITIAVTATSHEPAPALSDVARDRLKDYALEALEPGDATVDVIVQGQAQVSFDLTPMRGQEVEADPTRATRLIEAAIADLGSAIATSATDTDGLDTLGVYDQALQATPDGGTIMMVGSGISTVDPVDLTRAGEWSLHPEQFVRHIRPSDLPDATGRHIIWTGLGHPAPNSSQPAPGTAARTAITTLWSTICRASGATTCTTLPGPAGTTAPTATNRVENVAFDEVSTHCLGSTSISADIAFSPDSADLTPAADSVLRPLARSLVNCPTGRVINAIGHAAEVPGGGDGIALSRERAQAILSRLRALGAPAQTIGTATGYGNASHQIIDNTPDDLYDETLAKLNRTVELTIANR